MLKIISRIAPGFALTRSAVAPMPVLRAVTPAKAYVYLMLNTYATRQILTVDSDGLLT